LDPGVRRPFRPVTTPLKVKILCDVLFFGYELFVSQLRVARDQGAKPEYTVWRL